jgi:hypothetical protein
MNTNLFKWVGFGKYKILKSVYRHDIIYLHDGTKRIAEKTYFMGDEIVGDEIGDGIVVHNVMTIVSPIITVNA